MSLHEGRLNHRGRRDVMAAWTEQAACTGRPDLMDPPQHTAWTLGAALALCHHCPVLEQCRQWALSIPGHADPGFVAGGLTEEERRLTEYGRLRAAGLNQRAQESA